MSGRADGAATLADRKARLFELLLQKAQRKRQLPDPIRRRGKDARAELSYAQEGIWYLEQLGNLGAAYHMPAAVRLTGALDEDAFERSLRALVARHEALRTRFVASDGRVFQAIDSAERFQLDRIDLSHLPHELRDVELRRLAQMEAQRPFDLANGPLFRATLAHLAEGDNAVFVCMHHLVSDGWSIGIIIREMAILYGAYARGLPSPLPELPVQYADFAIWQRERMQREVFEDQIDYWKRRLKGAPAVLNLLTDEMRPHAQSLNGAAVYFSLSSELVRSLQDLGRAAGATFYMVLLAAWQLLLARYSGQHDILVGSPISGRTSSELEGVVGLFLSTVVMRTDLSGNPTFRGLLARVKDVALEAYAHQDLPFEKIVQEVNPVREPGRHPIFQIALTLQNQPEESLSLPDLALTPISSNLFRAKIDLSLMIHEGPQGCNCELQYVVDLFDRVAMEQLAAHFRTLLGEIVRTPDCPILGLPFLTEAERQELRGHQSAPHRYPRELCIHERFERQARSTPAAIAVICGTAQVTYEQLNRRADRIAGHLRRKGAGPEVAVGLCAERSVEMIAGMIGILKAGAACLPLDPDHPRERLAHLLSDAAASICLTASKFADRLSMFSGTVVELDLSDEWGGVDASPPGLQGGLISPTILAYIIYTSGSTGLPKGVMCTHGGLVNLIDATIRKFSLAASSRVLQCISVGYDASLWEIFTTLCCGASLYIAPRETLLSPSGLVDFVERNSITVLSPSPSLLALLPAAEFSKVRTIHTGGESFSPALAARWCTGRAFFNVYGPTEAAVASAWHFVETAPPEKRRVPIGTAVDNVRLYVLDSLGELVPAGVPGELYIGGVGVARGYLGHPGLTAEKFVPNTFASRGERLYRTGDRVVRQQDGNLVFLGRLDRQVKIRGIRIEPMEVEAALARHPSVAQAAVVIRTIGGEDRLVAYVVVAPGFLFEARTLKSFAKDVLPTHLRPALFVSIDAMPKTTSGKVDLNALLEPIDHVESRPIPPVTEVQKRLARIWNEVLGIGQVSLTDNLFERGGSSLSAIKVYLRINEEFSIDLPFRLIIEAADLATLASEIEAAVAKAAARRGTVYLAGSVRPAEPSADYDQETKLDLSLQALPGPIAPFTEVDTVVVTGVTGFLGAFTARSLLERTKARVFCPVRARSVEEARIRVEQVLAASGVRSREFLDRVFSFCGDLSRPGLGLSSVDYERIATEADAVFHCGRMSNFILPYASHRAVNVTATRDVLRLAATTRSKAVHFASTLTVGGALQHGYGQSRWVAEQLVKGAHERGFGVAVYRAGRLAGDTRTGAFPSGQFIGALLKGCIELGCVPKFKDLKVDLTPADYIGECMVALACLPDALGKAFTVCHPELTEWDAIVDGLRRFGYSLRASDLTTWLDGLRMRLDQSALAPYWPVLEGWRRSGEIVAPDNFPVDALETIDAGTVQRMVEPAGIVCPRIDERVLGRYLTELVRTGYLAPPAAARHDAKIKRNESARSNGR